MSGQLLRSPLSLSLASNILYVLSIEASRLTGFPTGRRRWPPPLAAAAGRLRWPSPLSATAGRRRWPSPLTAAAGHHRWPWPLAAATGHLDWSFPHLFNQHGVPSLPQSARVDRIVSPSCPSRRLRPLHVVLTASQKLHTIDQITRKTPNPKCRLYWCLIEFIDWRHSQSCWYF